MQELAEFLGYLDGWAQYVGGLKDYTPAQKETMLLSRETREGIKISGIYIYNLHYLSRIGTHVHYYTNFILSHSQYTVLSFIEMAQVLLAVPGAKFLLSARFSQDPAEEYFGRQSQ